MKWLNKEYAQLEKLQKRDDALHRQWTRPRGKRSRGQGVGRGRWFPGIEGNLPLHVYYRLRYPNEHQAIASKLPSVRHGKPGARWAERIWLHCVYYR